MSFLGTHFMRWSRINRITLFTFQNKKVSLVLMHHLRSSSIVDWVNVVCIHCAKIQFRRNIWQGSSQTGLQTVGGPHWTNAVAPSGVEKWKSEIKAWLEARGINYQKVSCVSRGIPRSVEYIQGYMRRSFWTKLLCRLQDWARPWECSTGTRWFISRWS